MNGTIQGIPLDEFFKVNGIPFDEYYERDGVRICLKPVEGTPRSVINDAIKQLRYDRDLLGYTIQYQKGSNE